MRNLEMITIEELLKLCEQQIANGNGNKKIALRSSDAVGVFRGLYSGFTPADSVFGDEYGEFCQYNIPALMKDEPLSKFVVLG